MSTVKLTNPQIQLRQTRGEFRGLIGEVKSDGFPRSKTMKLLLGAGGKSTVAHLLTSTGIGSLLGMTSGSSSRLGRAFRSVVVGVVIKGLWSRLRR